MVEDLLDQEDAAFGVLTGYAGTGKTTMIKNIAEAHDPPLILTPTGKAALRVSEATGLKASTIHKWLYHAAENPKTGDITWQKKPPEMIPLPGNGLIVIDEASMVGDAIWSDIWAMASSLGLRVLLVGDRFQLGPVQRPDEAGFAPLVSLKTSFRADLTEVVRQALDSPIIRASMMIRQGEEQAMEAVMNLIPSVNQSDLISSFLAMDPNRALIAHRNTTRQSLNLEVRRALGYSEHGLVGGEPLLVLFNSYNPERDRFNGEVIDFQRWTTLPGDQIAVRDRYKNISAMMSFGLAEVDGSTVILSEEEVFARSNGMPETTILRAARDYAVATYGYERKTAPPHLNANLGYCLTAHKAQGSEWNDVMVVVEPSLRNTFGIDGRRWLYTSLTRGRKNATLCLL